VAEPQRRGRQEIGDGEWGPVFIVGCGRSGTTMLRLMLDRHPDLAIPGESHFIPDMWMMRSRYVSNGMLDVERLVRNILTTEEVAWWNVPEDAVWRRLRRLESPGFGGVVEAIFAAYADTQGKRRWGDKTPIYVTSIPLIAQLFPTARFIHLIRDGRDVALSYLSIPSGPDNVWQAARRWRRDVNAGRRAGRALESGRYLEVRYEDLVARPARQLRIICAFLDLSFDPGLLEADASALEKVRPSWRFIHARVELPPTQGLRDWRREMRVSNQIAFEAVAGATLMELGYERRYRTIPFSYRLRGLLGGGAAVAHDRASRAKTALQRALSAG
jgi:Sulfotransferase family